MTQPEPGRTAIPATPSGEPIDAPAFEALYQSHWPLLVDYLRFRIGPADAADIAADVFARAWSSRGQFDAARGDAAAWLWGIARNAARDCKRRARHDERLGESARADTDLETTAARRETMDRVATAVTQLRPIDQEIVSLRFGAGLKHREIGRLLGLAEDAAGQRLHRAVRQLRHLLEGSGP
jgi:RNA polymerase sigma-70 factor (ECF subfamily)